MPVVEHVVRLRWRNIFGPVEIAERLGHAGLDRRRGAGPLGLNQISRIDRVTGEPLRRYVHDLPGRRFAWTSWTSARPWNHVAHDPTRRPRPRTLRQSPSTGRLGPSCRRRETWHSLALRHRTGHGRARMGDLAPRGPSCAYLRRRHLRPPAARAHLVRRARAPRQTLRRSSRQPPARSTGEPRSLPEWAPPDTGDDRLLPLGRTHPLPSLQARAGSPFHAHALLIHRHIPRASRGQLRSCSPLLTPQPGSPP